jgi:hypothetical protein
MKFSKEYNLEKHLAIHAHPPTVQVRSLKAVLRIRIRMFLGLLDPDPDPLVRGMNPIRIHLSPSKNIKKNLDSYVLLCDIFLTFYL